MFYIEWFLEIIEEQLPNIYCSLLNLRSFMFYTVRLRDTLAIALEMSWTIKFNYLLFNNAILIFSIL